MSHSGEVPVERRIDASAGISEQVQPPRETVDVIELDPGEPGADVSHTVRVHRDVVRNGVHKGDPSTVSGDMQAVTDQEHAFAVGCAGPMQHATAREVTGRMDQCGVRSES
jgi:hypothetical protein